MRLVARLLLTMRSSKSIVLLSIDARSGILWFTNHQKEMVYTTCLQHVRLALRLA